MKLLLPFAAAVPVVILFFASAQRTERHAINLPTSKMLSAPSIGRIGFTNSFPATIALSPDGRYAALLNDGYGVQETQAHQSIAILDMNTNELSDFRDDRFPEDAHQSYFLGLVFSSDGKQLYASVGSVTDPNGEKPGDTSNGIAVYSFHEGKVVRERFIKIPPQKLAANRRIAKELAKLPKGEAISFPAGLALLSSERLLVANNLSDNLILLDVNSGRILKTFDLSTNELVPSSFPYTVVASRDGQRAWCSLWNASRVAELDLAKGKVTRWIPLLEPPNSTDPGSHPTTMLLSPDEKQLYVALSNADTVAAVPTEGSKPVTYFDTRLPKQRYAGTSPTALALSGDGTRLFVADASLNAVAVFDVSAVHDGETGNSRLAAGFIPTDWYPSALATHGDDLLIATAKGEGTGPNAGPNIIKTEKRHPTHPYIAELLRGSIGRLNFKTAESNLAELTVEVEQNNLLRGDPGKIEFRSGINPIRHVIYIIRENRTYDQILGDLGVGNGDPSLTMYGSDITPNAHKLALQFGVLDNFYDSGEVSGNGHVWSNAAITSDYNERTWQIAYRGKERSYDFGGAVAGEYALDHGESDIDDPQTGFLWGDLARHGLTYRDYGEFIGAEWCMPEPGSASPREASKRAEEGCSRRAVKKGETLPPNVGQPHSSPSPWPWVVPLLKSTTGTKAELRGHFDPVYPNFRLDYPDQLRADEFLNEFEEFVRARKEGKGEELPSFVLLYLPDDHTAGTRPGMPRPAASVADNDLALGRVVEAVSHSPYWDDTAIFVLEDDAQNGADHVDAHRSIAFVISKYSPGSADHPFVAHQFYTTVNLVHTMEELLGLPPMNQNDAYAPVMAPLFSGPGDQAAFNADWRNRDNSLIYQMNPAKGPGAEISKRLDFSRPDAADASVLNKILWRDRKGNAAMPSPKHTVFAPGD
ncbi:MAG TPA: bifunctional YncE family protein/alkaline phosphatase family protein [Terriglobales bacterium]|nr:bifunctional YncE family protein/alkaline phosphatase family protein [Terriglobales bacterium]